MSKPAPIPPEQTAPAHHPAARLDSARPDRRDIKNGGEPTPPSDAVDVDVEKQGRFGAVRQNLTPRRRVQDR